MTRLLILAAMLFSACQGRSQGTVSQPAAEGPPAKAPAKKADAPSKATKPPTPGPGTIEVKHAVAWLKAYMDLGEALVHSQAVKATDFARTMAAAKPPQILRSQLSGFPTDLKGQRFRFSKISAELHKVWLADKALQAGTAIMHCPMVPADWIQPAGILRNPYMPETMLHCGYQVAPKK